jgi:thioredoxin reductase
LKRVAIIGAGPMGLEAALYALRLGHQATVYERGEVGDHLDRWGQVRMFSPFRMNVSPLGLKELTTRGGSAPDLEECPTGRELRERYLLPLAEMLREAIRTSTEVLGVSRAGLLKTEAIGGDRRSSCPFLLLLLDKRSGEETAAEAEVVLDASGVYANPGFLGPGGLPAPGERALGEAIAHGLPDLLSGERARFAGKRVLLVGGGHSAATNLLALEQLRSEEPSTSIVWAYRKDSSSPLEEVAGDPLPARAALSRESNRIAGERRGAVRVLAGRVVERISPAGGGLRVRLADRKGERIEIEVDRIISSTGFRPDLTISRELQAHHCYASEGPMRLAAKLLGGGGDCLRQPRLGPDAHRHPEPGFFVLGQKSYGRNPAFLLAAGREGLRDVFRIVEGKDDLDLYGGAG